ncbi:DMT family transporter [Agrobacterium rosae]|uniref:Carboxylate/amino acid/amine transporter n=1 Tax=Agrobacterium rosae TaxID=1972867 RepID=A0A1R3U267_9HYPH|nr:DMT family transporter [Agrobacterium rosae]SCX35327.1 carboxylate/amino acid/amine transporter [Agrobacterium rosae]
MVFQKIRNDNNVAGYLLAFLGFASFSGMDVISKKLVETHSLSQVLFISGIFTLLFASVLAKPLGGFRVETTKILFIIIGRGIMSVAMIWLTLFALTRMPLAEVYSIRFASPALTVLLALFLLKESPSHLQWLSVALGFMGIVVILKPQGNLETIAASVALGAAFAQSISIIMVRAWRTHSTPLADTLIPVGILVAITGVFMPNGYIPPTYREWGLYAAAGALLALGRLCLTYSIRMAQSSVIAPVQYSQLLWGLLFGWLLFSDAPTPTLLAGAALIILSSTIGIWDARQRREPRES